MTPSRSFDVPEVLSVQQFPSEEVRMVPSEPTVTNDTVELFVHVVLDVLLDELQEMKMELKRRRKDKMMSICLTRFPISG